MDGISTLSSKPESVARRFNRVFDVEPETIRKLSHSKRFLERWTADEAFRNSVLDGTLTLQGAQELCGCLIDVQSLLPVFHPDYMVHRANATMADWPLTFLWNQHIKESLEVRDVIIALAGSGGVTPRFDQWRWRNINRAAVQLDISAIGITHPPVAFELSSGCSVGCWFCGISAEEFKGHATLNDGGDVEWRKTLESVKGILGEGAECGFCYWATDPLDNPEYVEFLEIFEDVIGVIPQTTTAIPLRNVELTKRVLKEWQKRKTTPNRFSVMTIRQLLEIHAKFTPEELYGVEIVLQTGKEMAIKKFSAGRNFIKPSKKEISEEGTIACVTGFLINIVEKTVKLISPTMPSTKWPNGYIIYDSRAYKDSDDLKVVLNDIVEKNMAVNMAGDKPLKISDGGEFDPMRNSKGIMYRRIEFVNDFVEVVGEKLSRGNHSPIDIASHCMEHGMPLLQTVADLEKLWQEGIIEHADA